MVVKYRRYVSSETSLPTAVNEAPVHRGDIQGLRAIAVVIVVLAHAHIRGMDGGFVGVDVFFVISGFVITSLLNRQPPRQIWRNLATFYSRRIRRIIPAATLTLVATTVVGWWLLGTAFPESLLLDVRWASLFGANFRLIATSSDYFIPGLQPSLITHFWSLAVEEQFYVFFPVVVFSLTWIAAKRFRTVVLGVVVVVAIAASAWWSWHSGLSDQTVAAYYSPFTRFFELALGGFVALLPSAWLQRAKWLATLGSLVGLGGIAYSVWRMESVVAFPGTLAWWPCGAAALLLYFGAHNYRFGPSAILRFRPVSYVGDVSYAFYLFHFAWIQIPLQMAHPLRGAWVTPMSIGGAFLCAVLSYHLLENPIRRSKRLDRDGWSVLLMLAVCLALTWNATYLVGYLVKH
jgi:peptidoglycan/LPS O-acetylase OafA/YrhL